jgi:hypothetical protein
MPVGLKTALAAAGVSAITAVAILGGATPAFAKSSETLNGPSVARAGHPFQLSVWVGDDGGAKPASSRLRVRGPHGGYQWLGTWHKLHGLGMGDRNDETYTFTVTENHRGTYTFLAVITGYLSTSPITVVVR